MEPVENSTGSFVGDIKAEINLAARRCRANVYSRKSFTGKMFFTSIE
jgi:hypothetical protein